MGRTVRPVGEGRKRGVSPKALLSDDLDGVLAALERGLASPEHAAFVARLAVARRTP
jgi:hypothetical protein